MGSEVIRVDVLRTYNFRRHSLLFIKLTGVSFISRIHNNITMHNTKLTENL